MNSVRSKIMLLLLLLLQIGSARADVLVLVHGWSSDSETWVRSGVVQVLDANGWANAGVVTAVAGGISYLPAPGQNSSNSVYRVNLPAEAPLMLQSRILISELNYIRKNHPKESMTIAGHSAGGVVARLAIIQQDAPKVERLITIGSPNLGTSRAIQGLEIADSKPFFCPGPGVDFLKSMVGGDDYEYLKYSRGALIDLVPAGPGSLIDWLNHQPHPGIEYHSVIREIPAQGGDELVPSFSQDLNRVPVLQGKAKVHLTPAGHSLNPGDAGILLGILSRT